MGSSGDSTHAFCSYSGIDEGDRMESSPEPLHDGRLCAPAKSLTSISSRLVMPSRQMGQKRTEVAHCAQTARCMHGSRTTQRGASMHMEQCLPCGVPALNMCVLRSGKSSGDARSTRGVSSSSLGSSGSSLLLQHGRQQNATKYAIKAPPTRR